ncbi:MAG TPA: precorrin-3B C(17)-methyltransferase [Anaeromyxobacteraceae bacterium]|nr:precorrin-3B C(17)-methyltransferase [Anaeromyxobacteraceae bacterium]
MPEGTLSIVGIGPGAPDQMTGAARAAVAAADLVVGYRNYLDLLGPLLEGKERYAGKMTEEIDRARVAVERARGGARVALIGSGDAGVYGLAGLALELLREAGWKRGDAPAVEIVPGVTALLSCAARVGAPLGHDFCAISLSDLLTPWPVIERRVEAAAAADFAIAFYNPASARRREPLAKAREILLRHRPATTPVAVVTDAYREGERAVVTDLAGLADAEVGMTSTVLVGATSTFAWEGFLVTPRGYAAKYEWDGTARPGERPGAPLRAREDSKR